MRKLIAAMAIVGVLGAAAPAAAALRFQRYVALGDSYAAIADLTKLHGTPGCYRSTNNYPSILAAALPVATFVDVSCSSATTAHMTTAQSTGLGTNPPQFNSLTADTDLVTVTVGANDFGFQDVAITCGTLSVTDALGNPCQRYYTSGGTDKLAARIAQLTPKVSAVISGIQQRSPRAKIVVIGYLLLMPPTKGCWPTVPIAVGDVPYVNGLQAKIDDLLASQAAAIGATSVNPKDVVGHDSCKLPGIRWVEPVLPAAPTTPFHPNALGARNAAQLILTALG